MTITKRKYSKLIVQPNFYCNYVVSELRMVVSKKTLMKKLFYFKKIKIDSFILFIQ